MSVLAVAAIACGLLFPALAHADSYARIVRLSDMDGSVKIDRNTGQGFERAILNMPITQGVKIQTGDSGRAEVEFENGSVVRLAGDSSVEFSQLSLRADGNKASEVRVNGGTVYVDYKHKGDDEFRVAFADKTADLNHDAHFRLIVSGGNAELAVFKGEVEVPGQEMAKVKKNETIAFDLTDTMKYSLAKGVMALNTDDYDKERAQYLDQYASNRNYGNSPYRYGYSDMYRYGSFFDVPGYGLMWRPTGFGPMWDPYGNGYWSYYPGSGYVWVSDYAWGWTPYRYGSWLYVPSYGWCWRPGGWNQWNRGVAIVNPPPTYRNPNPPGSGSGSTVVVGQPGPRGPRKLDIDAMNPQRPTRGTTSTGAAQTTNPTANGAPARSAPDARTTNVNPPATTTNAVKPAPSVPAVKQEQRSVDTVRPSRTQAPPAAPARPASPPSVQPSRPVVTPRSEPRVAPAPRMEAPRASPPARPSGGGGHNPK